MKHDYTKLDAAILSAIADDARNFHSIVDACAPELETPFGDAPGWRVVDRRLQALRKAGRIAYGGTPARWRIRNRDGSVVKANGCAA